MFVEAHTVGSDDWTTLPDVSGDNTTNEPGISCTDGWTEDLHPFLNHYQTLNSDGTCSPTGNIGSPPGEWNAATGRSPGWETWEVDLSAYAGQTVEVAIAQVNDPAVQGINAFVDDIQVSTGEGTTSFEDDGDTLDGWTTPGSPAGSETNPNDWEPHRLGRVRGGLGGLHRRQPLLRLRVRGSEHDRAAQRAARTGDELPVRLTLGDGRRTAAARARPAPRARCGSSSAA